MYTQGQEYAKVGRVTVDIKGKSYRLRFTYPEKQRHEFSIARVSPEGWTTAIKAAQLISRDIDLGDFDDTYARYSPKHAKKLEIMQAEANKEYNLKELWEDYKKASINTISLTTQKTRWKQFDRYISEAPKSVLKASKIQDFIAYLQSRLSDGYVITLYRACVKTSVNLAIRKGKVSRNTLNAVKLPKQVNKKPECFEPDEVKAIIASFYSDEFNPKSSRYCHSYYAPMVEFLALTGCRPEECHALTWDDIKHKGGKAYIRFNKAYSKGVAMNHTKTHEIRLFPCNEQLEALLSRLPKIDNPLNLIFPSVEKGYVDQHNFRNRYWVKVVKGLVAQGKVEKYLKPYCLRHSFITRLIREGIDVATVAALSGNSPEIIVKSYLASKRDFNLPEL